MGRCRAPVSEVRNKDEVSYNVVKCSRHPPVLSRFPRSTTCTIHLTALEAGNLCNPSTARYLDHNKAIFISEIQNAQGTLPPRQQAKVLSLAKLKDESRQRTEAEAQILDRIIKFRQRGSHTTASEGEAKTALAIASRLMLAHNLGERTSTSTSPLERRLRAESQRCASSLSEAHRRRLSMNPGCVPLQRQYMCFSMSSAFTTTDTTAIILLGPFVVSVRIREQ